MKKELSRREMLGIGSVAGVCLIGAGVSGYAVGSLQPRTATHPWTYRGLKTTQAAKRGYLAFFDAGCMYGTFDAIIGLLAQKYGQPYSDFPMGMISYGSGGIAGWGSLCGCLNGAAAAIALFHTGADRSTLTNEIMAWYEQTSLPTYNPKEPLASSSLIHRSIADSVLCHSSITNWCEVSGHSTFSDERTERCARLVADVAAQTVKLLNSKRRDKFTPQFEVSAVATNCLSCHGRGNSPGDTVSKMNCTACHTDAHNQQ